MRITTVLILTILTIASCKKDNDTTPDVNPDVKELVWLTGTPDDKIDGVTMNCQTLIDMYLSKKLDFGSYNPLPSIDPHVGTIKLNDDGTVSNLWSGDDAFLSWSYYQVGDEYNCTVIRFRLVDPESNDNEIKEVLFSLTDYDTDKVVFIRLDSGTSYTFFPVD